MTIIPDDINRPHDDDSDEITYNAERLLAYMFGIAFLFILGYAVGYFAATARAAEAVINTLGN